MQLVIKSWRNSFEWLFFGPKMFERLKKAAQKPKRFLFLSHCAKLLYLGLACIAKMGTNGQPHLITWSQCHPAATHKWQLGALVSTAMTLWICDPKCRKIASLKRWRKMTMSKWKQARPARCVCHSWAKHFFLFYSETKIKETAQNPKVSFELRRGFAPAPAPAKANYF